jgi:hypothetical protein
MQNEDQYLERTPDLVAKVRILREAAEREMNRFTRVSDYDVRRVVGHGPMPAPVSTDTVLSSPVSGHPKKTSSKIPPNQPALDFSPAPAERVDDNGGKA